MSYNITIFIKINYIGTVFYVVVIIIIIIIIIIIGICSTPKESKYVIVLLFTYNATNELHYHDIHQD